MDVFGKDRQSLETLLRSYTQIGALSYSDQTKARAIINNMAKDLKGQIRSIPATDYTVCKNFLESLMFTTCKCQLG